MTPPDVGHGWRRTAEGGGGSRRVGGRHCMAADFSKPCGSFTTPTGTTIQLGPYGAVT